MFFGEPAFFEEDYTISTSELKRQQYVKVVEQIVQEFQKRLVEKCDAASEEDLFKWHELAWDCLGKVVDVESKLLAFDCEPYEELRSVLVC